jgi:carboxymethylenebutenolidase
MKKLLLYTLLLALPFAASAQKKQKNNSSCCTLTTTTVHDQVALLSMNEAFIATHLNPEEMNYQSAKGEMITFKTDSLDGRGFLIKSEKPTNLYVFVFQEWWGLNDYIKKEAEELQQKLGNVNVIALDLYDSKVATTREEAARIMGSTSPKRCVQIINGALAYAGKDASIATIGWCYGGSWSLQASLLAGKQAKACVMYYGMPESNVEKLKTLNCKVLGIFATEDKFITPEVVKTFEENMKKAGKTLTVKNFNADHAFANPSNPKYNEQYRKEAMELVLNFYKKNFNGKK